mgnify:CR=1 FL=1
MTAKQRKAGGAFKERRLPTAGAGRFGAEPHGVSLG